MTKEFLEARKADLEEMRDYLLRTLEVQADEFNQLFSEISTKDYPEIAREQRDHRTLGWLEVTDRERLLRVASALHRIGQGTYGVCATCGAPISGARLDAKPDSLLCIQCRRRREAEEGGE